ncbi:MAG: hypothetical protein DI566_01795 [Microbacterium sp.]|nr:MAG: hypothetical protein DI566_01795 [Microbacterium sp.]
MREIDIVTHRVASPVRRIVAAAAATALALTGVVALSSPAMAATGEIRGAVARDFNGNGVRDAGNSATATAADTGVAGVVVTAYDATGTPVATATTAANGTYSLDTGSVDDGTPLRLELTGLPEGFHPSRAGSGNGTSTQFAEVGDENINFLIDTPEDYAQSNAPILTAIQWPGLTTGTDVNEPALTASPWNATENAGGNFSQRTTLASYGQVGSIWGLTYDREGNDVYAAATYKRFSALGSLGLGGIYRVNEVLNASGALAGGSTVTAWANVNGLPVTNGGTLNLGTVASNTARGLTANASDAGYDIDGFQKAGKVGIGGIAAVPGENRLLFVNLADRELYSVAAPLSGAAPTSVTRIPLASSALGLTATQHPYALTIYRGGVYVGYVDTGATAGQSADAAGLNAYVVKASIESVLAGAPSWSNVLTADLGYTKGNSVSNWGGETWGTTTQQQVSRWNTWTDNWSWGGNSLTYNTGTNAAPNSVGVNNDGVAVYPQAILSGLTFDTSGYLTLGFTDRTSVQSGNRNHAAIAGSTAFYETVASGDVLLAAPNAGGTFTLENNGVAGTRTTANTSVTNTQGPPSATSREFYNDDQNKGAQNNNATAGYTHRDNALGAVVAYPGLREVASTAFDPLSGIRLSGLSWFNVDNGTALRGYELQADTTGVEPATSFQKGGGLGGVALAQLPAPAQIGNRVWYDADGNGRQDPDEPAIGGAVATLYRANASGVPTGPALGTTTTDSTGEYYFNSSLWTDTRFSDPAADLVVVFSGPAAGTAVDLRNPVTGAAAAGDFAGSGLTWGDLALTDRYVGGEDNGSATESDSNADPANGRAPVTVTGPGANDHTIDAGYDATVSVDFTKLLASDSAPAPSGTEFQITVSLEDFRGNELPDEVFTVTVGPGGAHTIDLPAFTRITGITEANGDTYDVQFDPAAPTVADPLIVTPAAQASGGLSFEITNTFKTYAVGDYVWIDDDRDGVQDAGESPLDGVTVELYRPGVDGAPATLVDSTTTTAEGFYVFDELEPGDYFVQYVLSTADSAQYTFTTPTAGAVGVDSNASTVSTNGSGQVVGRSATFTLDEDNAQIIPSADYDAFDYAVRASHGIDPTWDAGVVLRTYAVGDYVWLDANGNGAQDAGEVPVDGVTVRLLDAAGNPAVDIHGDPVAATTTDAAGFYSFDELPAGSYRVEFALTAAQQSQYHYTTPDAAAVADTADSDAVLTGTAGVARTGVFVLDGTTADRRVTGAQYEAVNPAADISATDGIDPTWDAGLLASTYAVGDYVWIDTDDDGVQDAGESPLAGVTVHLLRPGVAGGEPTVVATTTTNAQGRYVFDGLPTGQYLVEFDLTTATGDYRFTTSNAGSDDAVDSDAVPATGSAQTARTTTFTLDQSTPRTPSATYSSAFGLATPLTASEGIDPRWDAGVVRKTYALGDVVWIDADRDGVQDAGESPLLGVTVRLLDGAGQPVLDGGGNPITDTTDANGRYLFDGLYAGDYVVEFQLTAAQSAEFVYTSTNIGANDAIDSDATVQASPAIGRTGVISLGGGSPLQSQSAYRTSTGDSSIVVTASEGIDPTWDAGVVPRTFAVGDYVWFDADRDGIQDAGEIPVQGVTVRLYDALGALVDETTTNASGHYVFDGLAPGDYEVEFALTGELADTYRFTTPGAGSDDTVDSDAVVDPDDISIARTPRFTLEYQGENLTPTGEYSVAELSATEGIDQTWDAGLVAPSYALGDYVWIDADRDGIQDSGEQPLSGVTVELYRVGEDEPIATTTTSATGEYVFDVLPAGSYQVRFVLTPAQSELYEFSPAGAGGDAAADSNASTDPTTLGYSPTIVLGPANTALVPADEYDGPTVAATEGIDPTWDAGVRVVGRPAVSIEKYDAISDGEGGWTEVNDADTLADGAVYTPGETRTIVIRVVNSGNEPLREVELTDGTISGGQVTSLVWTLPNDETLTAEPGEGGLVATWDDTFGAGTATWLPGEVITGVATLTVGLSDAPHVDRATVDATSAWTATPLTDSDDYAAFTGGIQVIKYDGGSADPVVRDGEDWIIPAKPLTDADQDANDAAHAVLYVPGIAGTVRWVVTNTGTTALTDIDLADVTGSGPAVGADWTADLSAFGGPSDYSFVTSGPWRGILPAGASFFATGRLTLGNAQTHTDTVDVEATVVVPAQDAETGEPTGEPLLDEGGAPVRATIDGETPYTVSDDDPYAATSGDLSGSGAEKGGALEIAVTGGVMQWSVAGLALVLLALGLVLVIRRRRRA